ncbi:MAG: tRNA dihydrouridine(20/20a) synthase DusA [Rhodobacterales bacterium]|nr:MAG: tRNA dihydrouridine(20/20a) synthase DusA [Rhodobacterales bacterium]
MTAKMHIQEHARLSVAPMMDWTDRWCRLFHRQMSRHALLYTEMVTAPALVRGGAVHLLDFAPAEQPVALQLGGSDPAELRDATAMGAERGYGEVNLNCGCPSDRVQSGTFGAVLMTQPELVGRLCAAMQGQGAEITVKCRLGVDDQDPQIALPRLLEEVAGAGVERVTIHARKAWLKGLSPKENRSIPPLDYDLALAMKDRFPGLHISLNGGIETLDAVRAQLARGFDGVMIGRAAYHQPYDILAEADMVWGGSPAAPRTDIARAMEPAIRAHLDEGGRLHQITRHMLGLFAGQPGARKWRQVLSTKATRDGAGWEVVEEALAALG